VELQDSLVTSALIVHPMLSGELDKTVDSICEILGQSEQIFVGPSMELVERDDAGQLRAIERDALPTRVTKYVDLRKIAKNDTESSVNCPEDLAKRIFSDKNWVGIPRIVAVSKYPTLTSTGRIIQKAGLDRESGVYVVSRPNDWLDVPELLSKFDVARAKVELKSIFKEYSFIRGDEGLAGCIALVLTGVARSAIDGPVPMFVAEATTPGAGKTMLIDLASIIATGEPAAMTTRVNSVETQKVIVSTIRAGGTWVVLDNERQGCVFACPNIASVLTSHSVVGRVLGKSENFTAKNRLMICATGNQLTFSNEICRRTLLIEIGKQAGREWEVPDLRKHVREIQPDLLRAALILLKHGLDGKPLKKQPLESFEAWSDMVRRAVIRCCKQDPCALVDAAISRDADEDANQLLAAAFIVLIREAIRKAPFASDGKHKYVNATKIAEQAVYARDSESTIAGVGSLPSLRLAADIVATRCPSKAGSSFDPLQIGKRATDVVGIVVDDKMIKKGGKHGHYRVVDAT